MKPYYSEAGITIYHGDCREVLPTLEPVDLVLTDPPYGIGYRSNLPKYDGSASDWGAIAGDATGVDISPLFSAASDQIIWGGEHYFQQLPHRGRWICWYKRSLAGRPNSMKGSDFELAWMSKKSGFYKLFQVIHGGAINANSTSGANNDPRSHPTEKPIPLLKSCIELFPQSKTIIDPFMGSGTTLRAAKDLGRKAIGIEIEEKYCEIAAKRMSQSVLDFGSKPVKSEQTQLIIK